MHRRALLRPFPDLIIETDASQMGWGGVCQSQGLVVSDGTEAPYQLSGASSGIGCAEKLICVFMCACEWTSAVAHLNRLGGTPSLVLSNLAFALWKWALKRNIFLSAEHLAGNLNIAADWESRNFIDSSN